MIETIIYKTFAERNPYTPKDYSHFLTEEENKNFVYFFGLDFSSAFNQYVKTLPIEQRYFTKTYFRRVFLWKIKKVFKLIEDFDYNKKYLNSLNKRFKSHGIEQSFYQRFDPHELFDKHHFIKYCLKSDDGNSIEFHFLYIYILSDEFLMKNFDYMEQQKNFKDLLIMEYKESLEEKFPQKGIKTKKEKI